MTCMEAPAGIAPSTTKHQTWLCMLCIFSKLSKEQIASIMSAMEGQLFDSQLTWEYFQKLQRDQAAEYMRVLHMDYEDLEVQSMLHDLLDRGKLFGYWNE